MKKFAIGALAAVLLLSGCGSDTAWTGGGGFKDLEGVSPMDPTRVVLVNNVNGFPNVVGMCIEGAGFATTTREAAGAITRVVEWDASNGGWCGLS
jgi:hypothetical protein